MFLHVTLEHRSSFGFVFKMEKCSLQIEETCFSKKIFISKSTPSLDLLMILKTLISNAPVCLIRVKETLTGVGQI